jgi:hypothetical protein
MINSILIRKLLVWLIISITLIVNYFLGIFIILSPNPFSIILISIFIPVLFILTFYSLTLIEKKTQKAPTKKKIYVWILFVLNFLFSFIIGLSQQMMISPFRDNMPIVLLPLLIILNYETE